MGCLFVCLLACLFVCLLVGSFTHVVRFCEWSRAGSVCQHDFLPVQRSGGADSKGRRRRGRMRGRRRSIEVGIRW